MTLTRNGKSEDFYFAKQELYLGEVEDMERCLLDHQPQRLPLSESQDIITTLETLVQSAKLGQPLRIP
jgi:hypothetical protein